jgi:hypothetical protein
MASYLKLAAHLQLVSWLRMSGTIPTFPICLIKYRGKAFLSILLYVDWQNICKVISNISSKKPLSYTRLDRNIQITIYREKGR